MLDRSGKMVGGASRGGMKKALRLGILLAVGFWAAECAGAVEAPGKVLRIGG